MNKEDIEFFEKIEKYQEGSLSVSDIEELKKALEDNPELAKKAELDSIIIETLKNHELQNSKDDVDRAMAMVKNAIEPLKKKQRHLFPFSNSIFKIAAAISFIAISIFSVSKYIQSNSIDATIISYLDEPFRSPAFYKAPDIKINDWKKKYQSGNYSEAQLSLQNFIQENNSNMEARFYLGLCYLYQKDRNPSAAIEQFSQVLAVKNRYDEQAIWYLGLSYYLAGDTQSAINTLKKVKGDKVEESENILERLK